MDIATVEAIATAIGTVVEEIIKVAPAIEQGAVTAEPYIAALVSLVEGNAVTQDQLDAAVAQVTALSAQFQQPLPPDDGSTTT
jgi:hypothetical protein